MTFAQTRKTKDDAFSIFTQGSAATTVGAGAGHTAVHVTAAAVGHAVGAPTAGALLGTACSTLCLPVTVAGGLLAGAAYLVWRFWD